jgi:predicted ATP-grasp superfamily ATP-dependent carboligase
MNATRNCRTPAFVLSNDHAKNPKRPYGEAGGLAIVRSLGRRGIPVIRLHPNLMDTAVRSRYCKPVVCPDTSEPTKLTDFLIRLAGECACRPVLFPSTDEAVLFLAQNEELVRKHFRIPMPRRDVVELVVNKKRQYETAASLGIPVPRTYYPTKHEELLAIAKEIGFPCIIKPIASYFWRRDLVREQLGIFKVKKVNSSRELEEFYSIFSTMSKDIMIQEIIPGEEQRLVTFIAYLDEGSKPIAYCTRRRIRQIPPGFGDTTFTDTCYEPRVVDLSIRLFQGIGYQGLGGIEFKLDPRDGQFKLVEINARSLHTGAIATACGVDLPFIAYLHMLGKKVREKTSFEAGVKWIELIRDISVSRRLIREKSLTWGEWLKSFTGKKVDSIFAWDDPLPFLRLFCSAMFHFMKEHV